jgi:trk system potassium uptake protein
MILSASNFALMYGAFRERWRRSGVTGNGASSSSSFSARQFPHFGDAAGDGTYAQADLALRDSLFAVSLVTTTGYVTADFDLWPTPAKLSAGLAHVHGGCAGSTGGGLKMLRCLMLLKIVGSLIEKVFRPRSIRQVRVGTP